MVIQSLKILDPSPRNTRSVEGLQAPPNLVVPDLRAHQLTRFNLLSNLTLT
jgi:hypothetical protein